MSGTSVQDAASVIGVRSVSQERGHGKWGTCAFGLFARKL